MKEVSDKLGNIFKAVFGYDRDPDSAWNYRRANPGHIAYNEIPNLGHRCLLSWDLPRGRRKLSSLACFIDKEFIFEFVIHDDYSEEEIVRIVRREIQKYCQNELDKCAARVEILLARKIMFEPVQSGQFPGTI